MKSESTAPTNNLKTNNSKSEFIKSNFINKLLHFGEMNSQTKQKNMKKPKKGTFIAPISVSTSTTSLMERARNLVELTSTVCSLD